MIVLSSRFGYADTENFDKWKWVDGIVRANIPSDMQPIAQRCGYEGLFDWAPSYFGMTRMYRNDQSYVTYEFTESQWTWFVLRWS